MNSGVYLRTQRKMDYVGQMQPALSHYLNQITEAELIAKVPGYAHI
jgi:hypothetical protein